MNQSIRNLRVGTCRAIVIALALSMGGCAASRLHSEGRDGMDAGQYEEGITKLEEAIKLEPNNTEYRVSLRMGRERAVRQLQLDAERALGAGKLDAAEAAYKRLLVVDPANSRAAAGLEQIARARRHAPLLDQAQKLFKQKNYNGAIANVRMVLSENPTHPGAVALLQQIDEIQVRNAHAPIRLKSRYVKPVTLQFRDGGLRMVFEALSKITGINFLFDSAVKDSQRVTIFVNDVSVEDTIDLILAQSQLAQKVLNDNTILVYPATPAKLKEYEEQVVRSFYLTNLEPKKAQGMLKTMLNANTIDLILAQSQLAQKVLNDNTILVYPATPAKLKEYEEQVVRSFYLTNLEPKKAQGMLKTMLNANTTFIEEKANLIVLRDTPEVVRMAEKLLAAADVAEPEVMLEVEVLEVKRSTLQNLGIDYPGQVNFSASNAAGALTGLTIDDLKNLDSSTIRVTPLSVGVNLSKQDGDANILASPRIRARNREKARIHIGDRVPVITNAVTPVSTGTPVVTGSIQYIDVGLKLEIEPTIHLDNDVAIKMTLEVSNIVKEVTNEQSGSVAYQIGTRNAATILRLRDGETQVLAGLISDEERKTANKIPGLGDIPLLGRLFGTQRDDNIKTEIVLSITPRLVRNIVRPDASNTEFWFGSEARKLGRPLTIHSVGRSEPLITRPAAKAEVPVSPAPAAAPPVSAPAAETIPAAAAAVAADAQSAEAPEESVPLVFQGPEKVTVGQTFQVALIVKAGQPVNGATAQLGYDPEVFEVVAVAAGSLSRKGPAPAQFTQKVDRGAGRIDIKILPVAGPGFTGTADATIVTFRAIGPKAQSPITLNSAELLGADGKSLASTMPSPLRLAANPP